MTLIRGRLFETQSSGKILGSAWSGHYW